MVRHRVRGKRRPAKRQRARRSGGIVEPARTVDLLEAIATHTDASPVLTGGDVDADWLGAAAAGDEAVGGSAPTPDQDVVDEIGRALGVEQASDAEVRTSDEILRARDRFYWHLERKAAVADDEPREGEEEP